MYTEFEFTLPQGYIDESGDVHRHGRIRLATALDEIEPMSDPRVQANSSYLPVLLLGRVITQLGQLPQPGPAVMERLFAADLAYLSDLYLRINSPASLVMATICPHWQHQYQLEVASVR
ncbi:MAG: phage tail assembly protein [Chloroflexota bacterium]